MSYAMTKTAIIGAGIAGLACARVLACQGHEVKVFDKGRGPGGRMSTRRAPTPMGEASFDHGAQYFTARDPAFVTEVARLTTLGAIAPWTGNLVRLHTDGTISPLANETLYVGAPGMNAVVRALGEGLNVVWATRVDGVQLVGRAWHLTSETGVDLGAYDQIVCAIPAEQVAPLIGSVAPNFADQAKAITSLPCWTGMFAFDRPLTTSFDALRLDGHPIVDFIANNQSKPGRTGPVSYVVQARPDWSAAHLEDAPETITKQLAQALMDVIEDRPNLIFQAAHRWRYARVDVSRGQGHLWDHTRNIGVCGDWLSGPRVESAWASGHHLGLAMRTAQVSGD